MSDAKDDSAKEAVKEVDDDTKEEESNDDTKKGADGKRKRGGEEGEKGEEDSGDAKKTKAEGDKEGEGESAPEPAPVLPSKEGISVFHDNDVLSGRGGGTNVHPGNRNFRDLINLHRRAYLKARKNDKPAISRAIVRSIRENNGRFLKKDEKTGLWLEIGDDAAREKTSQALRQRAPEMRKLLFDTEREEARAAAEEHMRQQRMMMNMPPEFMAAMQNMPPMMGPGGAPMFPPFMGMPPPGPDGMKMPNGAPAPNGQNPYSQMFNFMQQQQQQMQQQGGATRAPQQNSAYSFVDCFSCMFVSNFLSPHYMLPYRFANSRNSSRGK